MAGNNFYTVTKEINGKKYRAQFNGLSYSFRLLDNTYISESSSNHSNQKMAEMIFKDVIVEPAGLTIDSFDTMEECSEVIKFGMDVAQGKFRDEKDAGEEKSKG